MRSQKNRVVIFLTDATEQSARAKTSLGEEVRIIRIQREKKALGDKKPRVR